VAGTLNSSELQRDPAVDVARGIAIMLVVIGHNRALSSAAPAFIDALFLFHVPLFFLLSGWVQREQALPAAALNLARRLLLPLLAAALLVGTAKVITRGESFGELLLGLAWATGQTLPWSHLWFLPALFLALLFTQILRQVPGGAVRWMLASPAALAAVVYLPMTAAPAGWPWSVDLMPHCLLFVWLGALLHDSPKLRARLGRPWVIACLAALFGFALRARVDLNLRLYAPPLLASLAAMSGCLLTLALARGLATLRIPAALFATVGRHTLAIFLLHVSIQKVLLGWLTASWLSGLLSAAVAIAVSMALSAGSRHLMARWRETRSRDSSLRAREVAT
jgi:fucose 4-O-acetylase-like acetyltransferase